MNKCVCGYEWDPAVQAHRYCTRRNNRTGRRWFAWYPVKTIHGWRWLQRVWRVRDSIGSVEYYPL